MKNSVKIAIAQRWSSEASHSISWGISDYARLRPEWELISIPLDWLEQHPEIPEWDLDGMIVAALPQFCKLLQTLQHPVVSTTAHSQVPKSIPQADEDHAACGRMAAEALLAQGYKNFGCLSVENIEPQTLRAKAFVETLNSSSVSAAHLTITRARNTEQEEKIIDWLMQQPKPLALFATDDHSARKIVRLCKQQRIPIPGEVGLLGCENDRLLCKGITPNISSVALPYRRIGYEAAHLLDRMIQGEKVPFQTLFPPERVITRTSTDSLAVADPHLRRAIQFIREHTNERIQIETLAAHAGVSQRVLQKRFKEYFNRTPIEEIHRAKVERIKELLVSSHLSLSEICGQVDFATEAYLRTIFKRYTNLAPGQYRKRHRH